MSIAENILEQALAKVFDGKLAGTRMAFKDIATAWNNVGLRRSDLPDALQIMVDRNFLVHERDISDPSFVLTEQGSVRFYICLYCEPDLQDQLNTQRGIRRESVARIVLGQVLNRRSTRQQKSL